MTHPHEIEKEWHVSCSALHKTSFLENASYLQWNIYIHAANKDYVTFRLIQLYKVDKVAEIIFIFYYVLFFIFSHIRAIVFGSCVWTDLAWIIILASEQHIF